jgi:glycosyltransferase involved in cell wall biosynthesis
MRILAIHPILRSERIAPRAGGMARVSMQLTQGLVRSGHEVAVLPVPERIACEFNLSLDADRSVHVLPPMDLPEGTDMPCLMAAAFRQPGAFLHWQEAWYRLLMLAGLHRAIRKFQPDIIHNHHATSVFPELYQALGVQVPAMLTHHHFEPGHALGIYRGVVFPSAYALNTLGKSIQTSPCSGHVIHNPVDPAYIATCETLPARSKSVAYVGVVNKRKGIMRLLQAYASSTQLCSFPLTIYGDGDLLREAQAFSVRRQLPVRYAGWQQPDILQQELSQASVLVLPSQQESFGVVMAEALCCGTPVVGWSPTVRELSTALHLPVGLPLEESSQDGTVLARQILQVLNDGTYSESWRRDASAAAREYFRLDRYVERNLAVYEQILSAEKCTRS